MGVNKVLVYHHRSNGSPVVQGGLAQITTTQLDHILAENPQLQSNTKSIARGALVVEIHQSDLLTAEQVVAASNQPNFNANVASIKVPISVWIGNFLSSSPNELVILSKKA